MKAVFLDRDGTIIKDKEFLADQRDIILEDNAVEGVKLFNSLGFKVIVVTNQPVVARGVLTEAEVIAINEKIVALLKQHGANIDAVYFCPHHPEAHHPDIPAHALKYRIVCECRKPGAGMLRQAAADHKIDLSKSYMIGDRTADVLSGKNAGCRTILLKTGAAGKDAKYPAVPDFEAADLLAAAKIVSMHKTKAVILVGGKGERLGEITKFIPKPLILVANKPVVQHQIELLKQAGVVDIIMCGSYMVDKIKDYFGDGSAFGVNITYTDEPEPLGTGGAFKLAGKLIGDSETIIKLSGDIAIRGVDFIEITNFHRSRNALVTMILRDSDHPMDSDIVQIDQKGRVIEFIGRGQEKLTTGNTSLFVSDAKLFDFIPEGHSNMEKDVLSKIYRSQPVYGFKIKEGWIAKDMGTPERLESVRRMFGE